jgi:hypothetical protein
MRGEALSEIDRLSIFWDLGRSFEDQMRPALGPLHHGVAPWFAPWCRATFAPWCRATLSRQESAFGIIKRGLSLSKFTPKEFVQWLTPPMRLFPVPAS